MINVWQTNHNQEAQVAAARIAQNMSGGYHEKFLQLGFGKNGSYEFLYVIFSISILQIVLFRTLGGLGLQY